MINYFELFAQINNFCLLILNSSVNESPVSAANSSHSVA